MTALTIVAHILGGLVLLLWAVANFIAVLVGQEEKLAPTIGRSADMYVSAEEYEERREP